MCYSRAYVSGLMCNVLRQIHYNNNSACLFIIQYDHGMLIHAAIAIIHHLLKHNLKYIGAAYV